jgi:hypothetical protein
MKPAVAPSYHELVVFAAWPSCCGCFGGSSCWCCCLCFPHTDGEQLLLGCRAAGGLLLQLRLHRWGDM